MFLAPNTNDPIIFHERRIFAFLGFFVGGGLFFLMLMTGCSVILALTIITVGMIMLAFQAVAVKSNPNDLAPEYAGLINGLANTASNNAGSLTALMAGFLFDTDSFILIFSMLPYFGQNRTERSLH